MTRPKTFGTPYDTDEVARWVARTGRKAHAACGYEWIVGFANMHENSITAENCIQIITRRVPLTSDLTLAWWHTVDERRLEPIDVIRAREKASGVPWLPDGEVIETFGGKRLGESPDAWHSVRVLHACVRRILKRAIGGAGDPLRDPETGVYDFRIPARIQGSGRMPFGPGRPRSLDVVPAAIIFSDTGDSAPISNDLHDRLFAELAFLVAILKHRAPRPLNGAGAALPFWPLRLCQAPSCERFFFQNRRDVRFCSRSCKTRFNRTRAARRGLRPRPRLTHPPGR